MTPAQNLRNNKLALIWFIQSKMKICKVDFRKLLRYKIKNNSKSVLQFFFAMNAKKTWEIIYEIFWCQKQFSHFRPRYNKYF